MSNIEDSYIAWLKGEFEYIDGLYKKLDLRFISDEHYAKIRVERETLRKCYMKALEARRGDG